MTGCGGNGGDSGDETGKYKMGNLRRQGT